MRGAQTTKVPALHRTGKTLTDRDAGNVNFLTRNEMVSQDFSANFRQVARDAKFAQLALRCDAGFCELATQRLGRALGFLFADAENDSLVAVRAGDVATLLGLHGALFFSAHANNLAAIKRQDGDRHVAAALVKYACHANLAGKHAGTGCWQSH